MKMSLHTVRAYVRAIKHGQKFIYQTVPRLLTLWLDIGEHREMSEHKNYGYMLTEIERAIKIIPVYKACGFIIVRVQPLILFVVVYGLPTDCLQGRS